MREGFDREIDSLLRRHARGTAESRLWGEGAGNGPQQEAHLDADELNAFAEGALPTAARMAAASHLADCASCRGVAVGLASLAGAEVKSQEVKQHAVAAAAARAEPSRTSAWRALFASLFAPRVMRFAVPVLALSLVGAVSYIALRSDRGALNAAREGRRQNVSTQSAPTTANAPAEPAASANMSGSIEVNGNTSREAATLVEPPAAARGGHGAAEAPRPVEAETDAARDEQPSGAAAAPPPPAVATEGPAEMRKAAPPKTAAPEEAEVARTDNKEESQNRDKSARTSEAGEDLAANDSTRQRNVAQQRGLNQVQMPDGGARNAKRGDDSNASPGYSAGGGAPAPKDSDRAASRSETASRARPTREPRAPEKKSEDDEVVRIGETRSAAGHRFRREGNAWVDVKYKSNMPSTGVRRGTDSFRALVADVPEVGRVAEAVNGEVIVVVGGRAYRIH